MFLRLLRAELIKLREPIALMTLVAGPALVGFLMFLGTATREEPQPWFRLVQGMSTFWTVFLYPLSVVAFAAFAAQIEHRARAWDHLLALPAPKWMLFSAKALIVVLAAAAMYPLFVAALVSGGLLGGLISRAGPLSGPIGIEGIATPLALSVGASLALIVIQLWVSLRFSHFIVPVVVGVGASGATLAAMILGSDQARFSPWNLPSRVYGEAFFGRDVQELVAAGIIGGFVAFAAMLLHLGRREMR